MAGNRDGRHLRGVYGHGCLLYGYLAASRYGMNQKASSQDEIIPNCNRGARKCVVCDVDVCLTWVSFFSYVPPACLEHLMSASYASLVSSVHHGNPTLPLPSLLSISSAMFTCHSLLSPHSTQYTRSTSFSTHSPCTTPTTLQAPSTSALFCAKNSLNHFNGFSGSCVARCFIASSKYGVTC